MNQYELDWAVRAAYLYSLLETPRDMLLEKINSNRAEIENFVQGSFRWDRNNGNVRNVANEIESFRRDLAELEGDSLSREQVFALFDSGEVYRGFIAMLMWGHIYVGRQGAQLLRRAVSMDRHEVEKKLRNVQALMAAGDIRQAFNSLLRKGENKLHGLDVSFFTKLMYFMGWNLDIPLKPLIWDNKLQYVHCALLIEMDKSKAMDFYKLNKHGKLAFAAKDRSSIYMDYLERMHSFGLPADKLEAFLFKDENVKIAKGIVNAFFGEE